MLCTTYAFIFWVSVDSLKRWCVWRDDGEPRVVLLLLLNWTDCACVQISWRRIACRWLDSNHESNPAEYDSYALYNHCSTLVQITCMHDTVPSQPGTAAKIAIRSMTTRATSWLWRHWANVSVHTYVPFFRYSSSRKEILLKRIWNLIGLLSVHSNELCQQPIC